MAESGEGGGVKGTSEQGERRRRGGTAQHRTAREPEMVVVGDKGHLYFVRRYMHADERLSA